MTTSLIVEQLTVVRVFCWIVVAIRAAWYLAGIGITLGERLVERYLLKSRL